MSAVTERDVERAFVEAGRATGAEVLKLSSPGCAGVPDRLVLHPGGGVSLVEIKAPGRRPRPLQRRTFARLGALGHAVTVIDSVEAARGFWRGAPAEAGAS